jgi:hypothetical protein
VKKGQFIVEYFQTMVDMIRFLARIGTSLAEERQGSDPRVPSSLARSGLRLDEFCQFSMGKDNARVALERLEVVFGHLIACFRNDQ